MRIEPIYDQHSRVANWVWNRMTFPGYIPERYSAIGGELNGEIVCATVYHDFRQLSYGLECEMSVALDNRYLTLFPRSLKIAFGYPFLQLGVVRITAGIHCKNADSLNIIERIGFKKEGVLRSRFAPNEDCHIFAMLKSDCPWLPIAYRNLQQEFIKKE